jgi:hypothetical protein
MSGYSIKNMTLKVQSQYRWTMAFSEAYVLERYVNGLSHERAFRLAMSNPMLRASDKPKVN